MDFKWKKKQMKKTNQKADEESTLENEEMDTTNMPDLETLSENAPVQIYVNKIQNCFQFCSYNF